MFVSLGGATQQQRLWWQWQWHQKHLNIDQDNKDNEGKVMVKDHTNSDEGGSIATNVIDDNWGCRFLRVAIKAISNGKGNAHDNLQDDAATNIFSDLIGIDGH